MLTNIRQIILIILLIIPGVNIASVQDTLRLSLPDARRLALDKNTMIRNSQLDMKIAEKRVWEVTAMGLPHVDGKAVYTYLPKVPSLSASFFGAAAGKDSNAVIPLAVKNMIVYDLTVSQLIFNGSYIIGLQAAKAYHNYEKENVEKTMLEVNEAVTNTYYMILVAEESKRILNQNLQNVEKTLYEIREMNKQGFVEVTDVDQLELTANTIRNALNQIDSNLDVAYRLLKIQMGVDEKQSIALTDIIESSEILTTNAQNLINVPFNLEQNIDYRILKSTELLAGYDYKREMTNSLPVIASYFNHEEKWNRPIFDFAPKNVVGISLTLPIFSSGQRSAAVFQKKLALEEATNTKVYAANSTLMQAEQYRNDLKLKLDKYLIQKKSKELSDNIYQRTLEKYKQGISSSLDLLTSQSQYLTNLTNYYQSIYDLEVSKSKLEKLYNINQAIGNRQ